MATYYYLLRPCFTTARRRVPYDVSFCPRYLISTSIYLYICPCRVVVCLYGQVWPSMSQSLQSPAILRPFTCIHYMLSLCHGNDPRSSLRCDSPHPEGLIGTCGESVQSVLPSQVACMIQVVLLPWLYLVAGPCASTVRSMRGSGGEINSKMGRTRRFCWPSSVDAW
jgi:hypothetical protein